MTKKESLNINELLVDSDANEMKETKFYDTWEILYGSLTDLGSNKQNYIDDNLTKNLYDVEAITTAYDEPTGYDSFCIKTSDPSKVEEVVNYINNNNRYNETILTVKKIKSEHWGDKYYVYYPNNVRMLWEFLKPETRVQSLGDPKNVVIEFIELSEWTDNDTEDTIATKIKSEFPDIKDKLLKEMVEYTKDVIADLYDIETEKDINDKKFKAIQDYVWDYDWSKLKKNTSTSKIKEIILNKFSDISAENLKWAVNEVKDILDDIYFEENYKGENKMLTIEEAFKELNKQQSKKIVEAKEEKECCPECGKCPCECGKEVEEGCSCDTKVNEDVEITSDEIKDFIAKVGAEAIERALADFNGGAEEVIVDTPIEDPDLDVVPVDTPENPVEDVEVEETEEDAEENTEVESEEVEQEGEEITEGVAETMPAIPLDTQVVRDYIMNIPAPAPGRPPKFFKLGYIKELGSEIPAKFRGGRGSEGQPYVRIFKCTEYSALYTGNDWRNTDATKAADKVLGAERHTGEKTGFSYADEASANRIGTYADGSEALQAYIADHSKQKVKFFISLNDEDLHEASREEVAQYFTPAQAARLLTPGSSRVAAGIDAEGNNIYDKPINRFKLTNIYMIGNLGNSIM